MTWTSSRLPRYTRRTVQRAGALAAGATLLGGAAAGGTALAQGTLPGPITDVMGKPRYAQATWSLLVADVATGETIYALRPDELAFTGSVRKLFSVGLALQQLGPDHRSTTARCTAGGRPTKECSRATWCWSAPVTSPWAGGATPTARWP